ncbi:hypothetical protein CERSUDRAFT_95659 [Gelatoporia subvermispora B]|uniref:Cytochrome P450 n=1 Tax=Ceriporiopsis subvermispora (strain B) TaxID=914234 RepID=M2RC05_CERS8|nr:hypothetical protein CERSUDRAFT_95659 [Gelatoporia subvermispora B]
MGAVLPPVWTGTLPGNVDVLWDRWKTFSCGYPSDSHAKMSEKLGPTFAIDSMWRHHISTSDANVIKVNTASQIVTDFSKFSKGDLFRDIMRGFLGNGIFNSDGEMWRFHRHIARPFFSRVKAAKLDLFQAYSGNIIYHHMKVHGSSSDADSAIAKMKGRFREGHTVNFQDLASRYALDSSTQFLFGRSIGFLRDPLPYEWNAKRADSSPPNTPAERFAHSLRSLQEVVAERWRLQRIWPLFEILEDKCKTHMKVLNLFVNPIVREALERHSKLEHDSNERGARSPEPETFVDFMAHHTTDSVLIHDETLNMLLAARDSTSATITFTVYFLCMYPHVLNRLRAEVRATVGLTRCPTEDDIRNMRYLRAVIDETMRLYPPVSSNVRNATCDTTIPNSDPRGKPFFVPAGTSIVYSPLIVGRRQEYWGHDAEEFDPDRFLDGRRDKYLRRNPWIFVPFNAGPRTCLGQQFAYNAMSVFLIRLLQNFSEMHLAPEAQPPGTLPPDDWSTANGRKGKERFFPKKSITLYSSGGLWVRMDEG